MTLYDRIGVEYATRRQSDQRIAEQIHDRLRGATRVVNIGAGTGSYEPFDIELVAIEPSEEMISQRAEDAHPVIKASAEELPLEDGSFSHAMTVLSMHHWTDRHAAFMEIKRVCTHGLVAVSWNPDCAPFWLTRDYFPGIFEIDVGIFPRVNELNEYFSQVIMDPIMIPEDCMDGFLAAYWKRPEAYLDPSVRRSISSFAKSQELDRGLRMLEHDIRSGEWMRRNEHLMEMKEIDAGYVVISASMGSLRD